MAIIENAGELFTAQPTPTLTSGSLSGAIRLYDGREVDYAELYRTQPEVRTVVDFLARSISQIPLHAFRRLTDTDRERVTGTELTRTLDRPDIYSTRSRFMEALVKDLCIWDEAIRIKVRAEDGRLSLVRVPVSNVKPVGENWLRPEGYEIRGHKRTLYFASNEVIAIHGYNPTDVRRGLSPLATLRQLLAEQAAASEHREGLWRQGARAALVIERPLGAPQWSDTARSRFRAEWDSSFTGARNSGKTAVLEEGMVAKPLQTFSPRDAQYLEGSQLAREVVASAYGVPAGLLGLGNHTYSSLTEQHRQLYVDCLAPWLNLIAEEMENQLLPEFGESDDIYLEFQLADKLKGSFEEQAAVLQASVGAPYLTRNEARARLNLPAIDGGDELVTPLNVLVGGQASPQDSVSDERLLAARSSAAVKAAPDELELKATPRETLLRQRARAASELTDIVTKNLERQRRSVASKLGAQKSLTKKVTASAVFDQARFDKELADDLRPVLTNVARRAARTVADWDPEQGSSYFETVAGAVAKEINSRTRSRLTSAFDDLDEDGDYGSASDDIFDEAIEQDLPTRSSLLATQLGNFGRRSAAEQRGRGSKTWIVTSDNPRSTHAALNGETVPISDTFSNGARWPGDSDALDAEEIANCQCMVDFIG